MPGIGRAVSGRGPRGERVLSGSGLEWKGCREEAMLWMGGTRSRRDPEWKGPREKATLWVGGARNEMSLGLEGLQMGGTRMERV